MSDCGVKQGVLVWFGQCRNVSSLEHDMTVCHYGVHVNISLATCLCL